MSIMNKELLYQYWNKTELGKKMIVSNHVSDSDLLFLIPNNKKKMLGLPLTRTPGKQKRKRKNQKRKFILSFMLFDLIEETVENTLCSKWVKHAFFRKFVDIKNIGVGEKCFFVD